MKIAIRLDDITPKMDWVRFLEFKDLLDRHGIKPLIGVVPDNQDRELELCNSRMPTDRIGQLNFWEYIKELEKQGWVIAMHGYQHLYKTDKGGIFPLNNFSEFAGINYDCQLKMLKTGKNILEGHGIITDVFMAPAHSYDKLTLKALMELGFTGITDGYGKRPYLWKGLKFFPISFRQKGSLKKKCGYTTFVVHTNSINSAEMKRYENYFNNPGNTEWISYHEFMNVKSVKRQHFGSIFEYVMASMKRIFRATYIIKA